jgi:hypothetical protein
MTTAGKDTIYIDVEDEITAIIEKVVIAKHKIVAVVLPKRSTVFLSAVNLKLLKKASASAKKNLVLITSDPSIMSIAGSVGVHVAKTPTSKPVIPAAIAIRGMEQKVDIDENEISEEVPIANVSEEDEIEIDNTDTDTEEIRLDEKPKKKKIVKIPDFSSFKLRLGLGIALVAILIALWIVGFVVMPKAVITINTDVTNTPVSTTVTARVSATDVDTETNVIPAKLVQVEKVDSTTVEATGEKNIGAKATGSINLTNCIKTDGVQVVPAGTRFSAEGATFETTEQAILPEARFSGSGQCRSKENGDDKTVGAVAIEPGEKFNIGSQSLASSISGIVAVGSAMSGGTTENVKVVSQADVDKATQEVSGQSKNKALDELKAQLEEQNLKSLDVTLVEGTAKVVSEPAVGTEAGEVKVTRTVSYNMIGVSEDSVNTLLDSEITKIMADKPQNIRDNGQANVVFAVVDRPSGDDIKLSMQTVASIGPEIDQQAIKDQSAGQKRGDIEKRIESIEGVKSVSVEYSPFWITTTPKSANKITLVFNEQNDN